MEKQKYIVLTENELSALLHANRTDMHLVLWELLSYLRGQNMKYDGISMQENPISNTAWAFLEMLIYTSERHIDFLTGQNRTAQ